MLRGCERDLPVGPADGKDPRPDPDVSYAHAEALALSVGLGSEGFEMINWRDPEESVRYRSAMREHGLEAVCITANEGSGLPAAA